MLNRWKEIQIWNKKPVCIVTGIFALLVLVLGIRIALPNQTYTYESDVVLAPEYMGEEDVVVFDKIKLPMGTYHIQLQYEANMDYAGLCNVQDATVFTGGLLSHGEHMYAALEKTDYEMWLLEGTENLQVVISYGAKATVSVFGLAIVETNGLWTMLLSCVLALWCALMCAFAFYYYDRRVGVESEKKRSFFFLAAIAFTASLPFLYGFNLVGGDFTFHLLRIEGIKDGLMTGQFPVRLEPSWVYDHGYACGIFYCNALLYFPALLRLLGFTVSASYSAYCIALNIATVAISYHCFKRMFGDRTTALVTCALYTLSIMRIYKMVSVGAVGEAGAMTFLPLVACGLYRIFTEDPKQKAYKTAWIPLMAGYAGLIQTHVLSCEITAFVTIIFCLLHIRRFLVKEVWFAFIKAAGATVFVCLWFLVPFLDYFLTQNVHVQNISGRTIQFTGMLIAQLAFHFWKDGGNSSYDVEGMRDSHPASVGLVLFATLFVFTILAFSGKFREHKDGLLSFAKRSAIVAGLLLFMSLNVFPWDSIQGAHPILKSLVSSLEFPHRFLNWGTTCLIVLFGCLMWFYIERKQQVFRLLVIAGVFAVTTSSMMLSDYLRANQGHLELYNEEGMGSGYISGAEYLVEGTDESALTYAKPNSSDSVWMSDYEKSGLRATFTCTNDAQTEGWVDLPMLLYKGYRAFDQETGEELAVTAGANNVVRVEIPAGFDGSISARFVSPFYWRIAEAVTLATWVLFAVSAIRNRRREHV